MNGLLRFLPFVFIEKNTPSIAQSVDGLLGCFCNILDSWARREDYDGESYVEVMA